MKRKPVRILCLVAAALAVSGLSGDNFKPTTVDVATSLARDLRAFSLSNAPMAYSTNVVAWSGAPQLATSFTGIAGKMRAGAPNRADGFRDRGQIRAFLNLEQRVGPSLKMFLRPDRATPIQIKGGILAKALPVTASRDEQGAQTAKAFLRQNASLLLLDNPDEELQLAHQETDLLGQTTIRFVQTYQRLPVWPAEIGVHLDSKGNVTVFGGAYESTPIGIQTRPTLTAEQALAKAKDAVPDGNQGSATKPSLVIYAPLDRPPRLGWKLDLGSSLDHYWSIVIDAADGSTLRTVNLCMAGNVAGSGTDLLGATVPLNVWQAGSTYYLWDTSKAMFNPLSGTGVIYTYDAIDATTSQITANNTLQNIFNVASGSSTSWNNPNAVSAAFNLSQVYDYYWQRFGRNSYNNTGGDLSGVVRIGQLQNAFWHGGFQMMFFGDADRYPGSLDVIGHEVTHGVINSIGTQGVLDYQNQPGALNEALADIFGEMVEAHARGTNDWLMGSQLISPVRNMAEPAAYGQPAQMSAYVAMTSDNGGVHKNSGIIDHAYYLLVVGLDEAIGDRDAEAIFYRSLTHYLQPLSQFIDARLACIVSAEDLFGVGSVQALKTAEAFDAVQIYAAPASAPEPSSVNAAVQANDSLLFIRENSSLTGADLWRYESAQGDPPSGNNLVVNVKVARPSVTGDGTGVFFCGPDDGLYAIQTLGTNFKNFNVPGQVHSVAISPDGHYAALVLNSSFSVPTNQVTLLDLWANTNFTVNLVTPVSEGPPINNISYADTLNFSPDSKILIYDALSALRNPDGSLRKSWSIFALNVLTLQQYVVVPPSASFQIGNPMFSHTSDRFIAFDAEYTNGNTAICTLDLYRGSVGLAGVSQSGFGYPCFNGDDSFLIYADQDTSTASGRSLYAQILSADKMSTNSSRGLVKSDAKLGVIYRRGVYPSVDTLPTVTMTSPAQNAVFTAPAAVSLSASASHIGGAITRVEFYSGSRLVFTSTASPYTVIVTNVAAGVYRVYARAFDDQGASTTSPPVVFTVQPSAPSGLFNQGGATGFQFSLQLPQPGLYRLEASTNLVDWEDLGSTFCPTNFSYWDMRATNYPRRFYRAVSAP